MIDLAMQTSKAWQWANWQGKDYKGQVIRDVESAFTCFGGNRPTEFLCGDGDVWQQHGNVRSLAIAPSSPTPPWAGYQGPGSSYAGETEGMHRFHAIGIEMGPLATIGTLYEKHHSNEMAKIAPVAPYRIVSKGGRLQLSIGTGEAVSSGWRTWFQGLDIGPAPVNGIARLVLEVAYTSKANGIINLYRVSDGGNAVQLVDGSKLNLSAGTLPWTKIGALAGVVQVLYSQGGVYTDGNPGRSRADNWARLFGEQIFDNLNDAIGALVDVPTRKLVKISEKPGAIELGWQAIPGAGGYRFYEDGAPVSRTFAAAERSAWFAKGKQLYEVTPLFITEVSSARQTYP